MELEQCWLAAIKHLLHMLRLMEEVEGVNSAYPNLSWIGGMLERSFVPLKSAAASIYGVGGVCQNNRANPFGSEKEWGVFARCIENKGLGGVPWCCWRDQNDTRRKYMEAEGVLARRIKMSLVSLRWRRWRVSS